MKQHIRDKPAGHWNRFSLYLVRRVDLIKEIEALLLRIADPTGNRRGGRLRRAVNLEPQLRRKMQEHHRAEMKEMFSQTVPSRRVSAAASPRKRPHCKKNGRKNKPSLSLKNLFRSYKRLYATHKNKEYKAIVRPSGAIKFAGRLYESPSAAAKAVTKKPANGWTFWRVRMDGELVQLRRLRGRT